MARYVELLQKGRGPIWINPDQVVLVEARSNQTLIHLPSGSDIYVEEICESVLKKLSE